MAGRQGIRAVCEKSRFEPLKHADATSRAELWARTDPAAPPRRCHDERRRVCRACARRGPGCCCRPPATRLRPGVECEFEPRRRDFGALGA